MSDQRAISDEVVEVIGSSFYGKVWTSRDFALGERLRTGVRSVAAAVEPIIRRQVVERSRGDAFDETIEALTAAGQYAAVDVVRRVRDGR